MVTRQSQAISQMFGRSGSDYIIIVDLEKDYSMLHPTTSGIVQNLEKKVLRCIRPQNHVCSRFIVPTDNAVRMTAELESIDEKLETELTKNLSNQERQELVILLRKILGLGGINI